MECPLRYFQLDIPIKKSDLYSITRTDKPSTSLKGNSLQEMRDIIQYPLV